MVTPKTLLFLRSVILVYAVVVMATSVALDVSEGKSFWGYFTFWTFLGIIVYFAVAVYNSYLYIYSSGQKVLDARPSLVKLLNWYLYMMPATCCYIVTIVFWVLLFPIWQGSQTRLWLTTSQHGANSLFMIFEFVFGSVPLVYQLVWPYLVTVGLYVALAFVYHAETGFWSYAFLDTSKRLFWVYYIGIGVLFLLVFLAVTACHRWRDAYRKCHSMDSIERN
ncbi:hypothetical protein BDR26DRAFT_864406 [Obelidium mucronatum]|nr:hypothetical protein BDR26DRAFT_864406 [Obelidium mucronatum]